MWKYTGSFASLDFTNTEFQKVPEIFAGCGSYELKSVQVNESAWAKYLLMLLTDANSSNADFFQAKKEQFFLKTDIVHCLHEIKFNFRKSNADDELKIA